MKIGAVILLFIFLAACSSEAEPHELVGAWRDNGLSFEFREDGTGLWNADEDTRFDFVWSMANGVFRMRVYYGSFDMAELPGAVYEIRVDEDGTEFLWFDSEWIGEEGLPVLYERVSGETGGLVGKWVHEINGEGFLRHTSYEFFADGTARYHSWQLIEHDPPMRPIEQEMHFIWREDDGYLAMIMFGEQDYEYIIDYDTLTIFIEGFKVGEFTRE